MKATFLRLPPEKQARILDRFLLEFTQHDYAHASLSNVVKDLGIAKGSVYQYFGSKLELYNHLQEICQTEKMRYVFGTKRQDYPDFWEWYKQMFAQGIRFDLERPLHSHFLYRSAHDRSNPELAALNKATLRRSLSAIEGLVKAEQASGQITDRYSASYIALSMISLSMSIRDYMELVLGIDLQAEVIQNATVFAHLEPQIMEYVQAMTQMLRTSFLSQSPS
jgi:AcrR family transcriptional regulator